MFRLQGLGLQDFGSTSLDLVMCSPPRSWRCDCRIVAAWSSFQGTFFLCVGRNLQDLKGPALGKKDWVQGLG